MYVYRHRYWYVNDHAPTWPHLFFFDRHQLPLLSISCYKKVLLYQKITKYFKFIGMVYTLASQWNGLGSITCGLLANVLFCIIVALLFLNYKL